MVQVLAPHHSLANSCSVDFLVSDMFSSLLSPGLQEELLAMSDSSLASLPSLLVSQEEEGLQGEVGRLVHTLREHTLEALGMVRQVSRALYSYVKSSVYR